MKKLQETRDLYSFNKVWTNDGKVMFKEDDSRLTKPIFYYEQCVTRSHYGELRGAGNYFVFCNF